MMNMFICYILCYVTKVLIKNVPRKSIERTEPHLEHPRTLLLLHEQIC
jgi:hypothetical protein